MPVLIQLRMLFVFFIARAHSWLMLSCLPRSPGCSQQNCYQPVSAQTVSLQKIIPSQMQPVHFSLLNFIRFLLAHSSAYLGPSEWWSRP